MILDTTTKSLQIVLLEAKTTSNCDITSSYADITSTTFTPGAFDLTSNGVTAVTVVAAPGASTQRSVQEIRLHNNDTVSHNVRVQLNDNGTIRVVNQQPVLSGGDYLYTPVGPIAVIGPTGPLGSTGGIGATGPTGTINPATFASSNLAILPSSNPGGGQPWLNNGFLMVGNPS